MSSLPLRFALAATPQASAEAVAEMRRILAAIDVDMEPVFASSYAGLYDAVHLHDADAAWCPPLVARDLQRDGAAEPCVCIVRNGSVHYFSAIVGGPDLHTPSDIKRFGWVSRMSAAGYLVPRSYLTSIGIDLSAQKESFFRSHARSMSALEAGVVDAIATYAYRAEGSPQAEPYVPHAFAGARLLATIGPIPGDVIVIARTLEASRAKALTDVLRAASLEVNGPIHTLMGATSFGAVPTGHLEALSRWIEHPVFSRPRAEV
jgi:ABC-type phosphate/phosphonate transport system substrate-binding protein